MSHFSGAVIIWQDRTCSRETKEEERGYQCPVRLTIQSTALILPVQKWTDEYQKHFLQIIILDYPPPLFFSVNCLFSSFSQAIIYYEAGPYLITLLI